MTHKNFLKCTSDRYVNLDHIERFIIAENEETNKYELHASVSRGSSFFKKSSVFYYYLIFEGTKEDCEWQLSTIVNIIGE